MRVSLRSRFVLGGLMTTAVWAGRAWYDTVLQPPASTALAVKALNGGDADASSVRSYEQEKDLATWAAFGVTAFGWAALLATYHDPPTTTIVDQRSIV